MTDEPDEIRAIIEDVLGDSRRCDEVAAVVGKRMREAGIPVDRVFISTRFQDGIYSDIFLGDAADIARFEVEARTLGSALVFEEMIKEFKERGRKPVTVELKDFKDIAVRYGGSYDRYLTSN
ncbi:hypothetical protein [Croceicoccus bisphenolivorans]|uniref:hypothetical protein n=1 Tax=Croceicoccus bisphenolivorans TaxID=1783232 RepID=UPI000831CC91|nr:hypothetical protein [Croceicoccus bisphenolivorans]